VQFDPQLLRVEMSASMKRGVIAEVRQAKPDPNFPDRLTLETPSVPPQGRVRIEFKVWPLQTVQPNAPGVYHLKATARALPDLISKPAELNIAIDPATSAGRA
jgi:hypothetical protein